MIGTLHDLICKGPADCTCAVVYRVREGYTADAWNERADSRIIGGLDLKLIPSGRGRSRTTRE